MLAVYDFVFHVFSPFILDRLFDAKETTKNSNFGVKGFAEAQEPKQEKRGKCKTSSNVASTVKFIQNLLSPNFS